MIVRASVLFVALLFAAGAAAAAIPGEGSWPALVVVVVGTLLPAIGAVGAAFKGRRSGGREGVAWMLLATALTTMTPVYLVDFLGWRGLENVLIAVTYTAGIIAVLITPLPNVLPHQRLVASLDALGFGLVVATATFWMVSGSEVALAGQAVYAITDATIMAMVAYVAVRRSQRRIDWHMVALVAGLAATLLASLMTSVSEIPYAIGHIVDVAYLASSSCFALAPLMPAKRDEVGQSILQPVRWSHVLAPYVLVAALAAGLLVHELTTWHVDRVGSAIGLGVLATMIVVLVRQLAMIAEQRRKVELEHRGVIATVSHELRTPLTSIVGFLDLLEEWDAFDEHEKVEMIATMRDQSHVMARVVGDLVAVAREELDRLELTRVAVPARALVGSAVSLVPELDGREVVVDVADHAVLSVDPERMLQVLINYLSNAALYGSARVAVVVRQTAVETILEVHDDGAGVPDVYRLVVWERFERGPQRQGSIPGSGIGLSVARGLARAHGGEAYYRDSERLGGACFAVRIPRVRPRPTPVAGERALSR